MISGNLPALVEVGTNVGDERRRPITDACDQSHACDAQSHLESMHVAFLSLTRAHPIERMTPMHLRAR
jgi:hypothetical protein